MLKTSTVGLLVVLAAGPAAATTDVEDIDGGPPGVLVVGPTAATIDVEDVDGRPLRVAVGISDSDHHRS
jgi:hypothetical protein